MAGIGSGGAGGGGGGCCRCPAPITRHAAVATNHSLDTNMCPPAVPYPENDRLSIVRRARISRPPLPPWAATPAPPLASPRTVPRPPACPRRRAAATPAAGAVLDHPALALDRARGTSTDG